MIKRWFCRLLGHKFWENVLVDMKYTGNYDEQWRTYERREYDRCLRCDHPRSK